MKQPGKILTLGISAFGFLLLILDSQTAFRGAAQGIDVCLRSVIPALFPFFILTILLTESLSGMSISFLRSLGKFLRIPNGTEGIFLIGLLGGYPSGAQCVIQAHRKGQLHLTDTRRMLGFCNNAGPAFIFGMIGPMFSSSIVPWSLWGIHILSAIITALLLPGGHPEFTVQHSGNGIGIREALSKSIRIMASVCGWIVLFRVILSFLERWILWLFPVTVKVFVTGILELSNGCLELGKIQNECFRYILCSGFLALGGICVLMQTVSVAETYGIGYYIPGKLLHTIISMALSSLTAAALFEDIAVTPLLSGIIFLILIISLCFLGINSRNSNLIGV